MSKAALRRYAFAQGRRIRPKPFPLKRTGPPAWSLTCGPQRQVVFLLPRALWPRGRAAPAGDLAGLQSALGDVLPAGVTSAEMRFQPLVARMPGRTWSR